MDRLPGLLGAFALIALLLPIAERFVFGSHAKRKREAKRVYKSLQTFVSPEMRMEVMRRMDPFAFEELVVYALKKHGYRAWHGRRYTGDGGIDGYVRVNGRKCYIQDKRYRGVIKPEHVALFSIICRKDKRHGYFVHTGKTGSSASYADSRYVSIISGERLLRLVNEDASSSLEAL